jgi:phosphate transport system protein
MNTLEKEIKNLKSEVLNMFFQVEKQWLKCRIAIIDFDQDIAGEITANEKRINALELKIDNDCENILALLSPVAIDLRFILSVYKINHELERIADIAENIANYVVNNNQAYPKEIIVELQLENMMIQLDSMLKNIKNSFEYDDTKIARKIFTKDKIINQYNAQAYKIIENNLDKFDRNNLLYLLSTVHKIERAGDSIKNIGEEIIFHLEAKVIKHKKPNS